MNDGVRIPDDVVAKLLAKQHETEQILITETDYLSEPAKTLLTYTRLQIATLKNLTRGAEENNK